MNPARLPTIECPIYKKKIGPVGEFLEAYCHEGMIDHIVTHYYSEEGKEEAPPASSRAINAPGVKIAPRPPALSWQPVNTPRGILRASSPTRASLLPSSQPPLGASIASSQPPPPVSQASPVSEQNRRLVRVETNTFLWGLDHYYEYQNRPETER